MASPFRRLSRPQDPAIGNIPTKSTLQAKQFEAFKNHLLSSKLNETTPYGNSGTLPQLPSIPEVTVHEPIQISPWTQMRQLGDLIQGPSKITLCKPRNKAEIIMLKKQNKHRSEREVQILKNTAHPNIVGLRCLFLYDEDIYIGLEYIKYTLVDLLYVHEPFEEEQIKSVAFSVFDALKYLKRVGMSHGNINLYTVRVCSYTARVLIGDFSTSDDGKGEIRSSKDLDDLGLLLLQCMDGDSRDDLREIEFVKNQRKKNKVFGLVKGEYWSGSQQLLDFLDDIFNVEKCVDLKFSRPHAYLKGKKPHMNALNLYTELVSMECVVTWIPYTD